jgi:hypothetical protein
MFRAGFELSNSRCELVSFSYRIGLRHQIIASKIREKNRVHSEHMMFLGTVFLWDMAPISRRKAANAHGHPCLEHKLLQYWHILTSLCCTLKSVLSGRTLRAAGVKNPCDDEGGAQQVK